MKELPKVFVNKIEKDFLNVQDIFYGKNSRDERNGNQEDVIKKINDIFSSKNHVYKSKVKILLKDKEIDKIIVGKTDHNLITINGELIKIIDILDIYKI